MDEISEMFGGFIESAKQNSGLYNKQSVPQDRWKHCVILYKSGWKPSKFQKTTNPETDDIVIIWEKAEQKDIHMKLSWTEQCLWLQYLEKKQADKNDKC